MNYDDLVVSLITGTSFMGLIIFFVIYFIILYRKRQRRFAEKLEISEEALLKAEVEIREQTLSDVSRELHDNMGQIASLIKINLNMIKAGTSKEDQDKLEDSMALLSQMITDIKELSVSLKGENLRRFGLIKMIETDIKRYERIGGVEVDFRHRFDVNDLEMEKQIFIYRMVQEVFNNISKHARAGNIDVDLKSSKKQFLLTITDDGIGYDQRLTSNGSGLENLKERCDLIHAELKIISTPGLGTTTSIRIEK